jgi:stalled ribosome alternative rescue factor ArfA
MSKASKPTQRHGAKSLVATPLYRSRVAPAKKGKRAYTRKGKEGRVRDDALSPAF